MKCFAALLWGLMLGGVQAAHADPIPVRYPQGTTHGFLTLRTEEGQQIALGDLVQTVHGDRVSGRLTFHFKDGSLDDDQVEFTQKRVFRLLRDHHVQRGPSYPKPTDIRVEVASGTVISREQQKDGSTKEKVEQMQLPPDLANGMMLTLMENLPPESGEVKLPIVVSFGGARMIHINVEPVGRVPFRVGGGRREAEDFIGKVDIGGVAGVVAPVLGKQPHPVHFWLLEGRAPAFVREEGQLYEGGPTWIIEQTSPSSPTNAPVP